MGEVVKLLAVVLVGFCSNVAWADIDCTPGSEWDSRNIRYQCLDEQGVRGFKPFGIETDFDFQIVSQNYRTP